MGRAKLILWASCKSIGWAMDKRVKLISLIVSYDDMMHAEIACNILLKNEVKEEDELYQPVLTAAIVAYARPFKKSRKLIALSPEWCSWHNDVQRELHRQMIGLRDTSIAHSDSSMHTVCLLPVVSNGRRVPNLIATRVISGDLSAKRISGMLGLIRESMKRIDSEKIRLINELHPNHSFPESGLKLEI